MPPLHPLLRKLCCRVLSKGIANLYRQLFYQPCPLRISHIRSLHCLCKVLPGHHVESRLTAVQLCRYFRTELPLETFLSLVVQSHLADPVNAGRQDVAEFFSYCHLIISHRIKCCSAVPVQIKHITSWNLNSLQAPSTSQGYKCAILSRFLRKGPVCIQETKWSDSDIVNFSTRWPGVLLVATPADGVRQHAKGGAAILLPPGCELVSQTCLVPACAVAAKISIGSSLIWLVSIYIRPESTRAECQFLFARIQTLSDAPVLLCGDINRVDVKFPDLWTSLLTDFGLHDVAPSLLTYFHPGGGSALDRFLIPEQAFHDNQLDCKIASRQFFVEQGHSALTLLLSHRPKLQRDPESVKHEIIPTQAFLLPPVPSGTEPRKHASHLHRLNRLLTQQSSLQLGDSSIFAHNDPDRGTLVPLSGRQHDLRAPQLLRPDRGTLVPPSEQPSSQLVTPGQLSFKATIWSWWKTVRSDLQHTCSFKSLYRKLRGQFTSIRISPKLLKSLQSACGLEELNPHHFPFHNGCHLVPSTMVHQALRQVELIQSASAAYVAPKPTPSPVLQAISQRQLWERLRAVCPKGSFFTGTIKNSSGAPCLTAKDYDAAMLDTRKFWAEEQCKFDVAWLPTLTVYQQCKTPWPKIPFPEVHDFQEHLLHTKDSAPGPDGIPYAAWRAFPSISAHTLYEDLQLLASDLNNRPCQVGVWIPKAQAGDSADFFRPLGMADTFDRLQDGTVAAQLFRHTKEWFHPSQTLLNHFREPQAAVVEIQHLIDRSNESLALFLDLAKAFERINPNWILTILYLVQAPMWVINVFRRLLQGRFIQHKIQGYLMPPRLVLSGVDMGRSSSVFLFCLAMDPILVALNSIPRVSLVSGYIDDTSLVGEISPTFEWLTQTMAFIKSWATAGICMDTHKCWQVGFAKHLRCPLRSVFPFNSYSDVADFSLCSGHPSLWEAASLLPLAVGPIVVSRAGCAVVFPYEELFVILQQGHPCISELIAIKCSCRAKTALVTNVPLANAQLAAIDRSGVGAHCVQGVTKNLGLPIQGAFQFTAEGNFEPSQAPSSFLTRCTKQLEKLKLRLTKLPSSAHSIRVRIIFFNTYCLSLFYYVQSIHCFTKQELQPLYVAMTDFILQRRWFPSNLLPGLLRWLKIGPLLDPHLMHAVSLLGFFHRSGGKITSLPPDSQHATRFERNVEKMWMSLQPYLTTSQCQQLYALERDIKHPHKLAHQFNRVLKALVIPALIAEAQDHVARRIHSLDCSVMPTFSFLEWLCTQTQFMVGAVPRFSVLRWALGEDSDLWFTIRTSPELPNSRTGRCCGCGMLGRNYPLGPAKGALCNECCPPKDPWYLLALTEHDKTTFYQLTTIQVPGAPPNLVRLADAVDSEGLPIPEQLLSPCPLCNTGANTIDHWLHFCPVSHLAFNLLLRPSQWVQLNWKTPASDVTGVVQSHLLFHLRRLVRERGALSPRYATDPMNLSNAYQTLARLVWESLPSSVAAHLWKPPGLNQSQCTFHSCLISSTIPPVHIDSSLLPKAGVYCSTRAEPGQVLAVLSTSDSMLRHFLPFNCSRSLATARVYLSHFQCECGSWHIRVVAAEQIEPFTFLSIAHSQHGASLLIQFDGSARQRDQLGGAGIVVLRATPESLSVVSWHAFALHRCKDNIYAEAFGCLEALRTASMRIQLALQAGEPAPETTVQGDILPIVNFLTFQGRFRRTDVLPLLEQCQVILSRFPAIHLEYKPRECNQFADHCAGCGTRAADPLSSQPSQKINVDPPFELCSVLGFVISSAFPSSPHDRTLPEKPQFSALNLKVLTHHPTYVKNFARYRKHFGKAGVSPFVLYRPTAFDQEGRLYAQTPSAQLFPKPLRLSLFGNTHVDVDMIQAHYELVRRISRSTTLLPAWKMRTWLKEVFDEWGIPVFPNFEKQWPTRLLNMATLEEMRTSLRNLGCRVIPEALEDFLFQLHSAKTTMVANLPPWCPDRHVQRGRGYSYRVLENLERTIVLRLMDTLQSLMAVESVVLIHDGFLISPAPPAEILSQAQRAVLTDLNVFDPEQPLFKTTDLRPAFMQLSQDVAHTQQAKVPTLPDMTLHSFWKVVAPKRKRACFENDAALKRQETRLTKRCKGVPRLLKRRSVSTFHTG